MQFGTLIQRSMNLQHDADYYISPTMLDTFTRYLDADDLWERFFGDSEEPSISLADFREKCEKELIDKLNGVPVVSEDASKGTAFNDIVDTLIHNKCCGKTKMQRIYDNPESDTKKIIGIRATVDDFSFDFDYSFCREAAKYFEGSTSQLRVDGEIDTELGKVHFLGYIDELRQDIVYDIKTCKAYEFGKYFNYNQRLVYPYCLIQSGMMNNVKEFEFTAFKLSGGNKRTPLITGSMYPEVYVYSHAEAEAKLRDICELFIGYIECNKEKFPNSRIFNKR